MIAWGSLIAVLVMEPSRAEVAWEAGVEAHDDDEQLAFATSYIDHHGRDGGADRLAIAHAIAGEVLWRRSCPVEGVLGACAEFTAANVRQFDCHDDPQVLTLHERNVAAARHARGHLDEALALAGDAARDAVTADRRQDLDGALESVRQARAAAKLEQALAVAPTPLSLRVDDWLRDVGTAAYARAWAEQAARRDATIAALERQFAGLQRSVAQIESDSGPSLGAARAGLVFANAHVRWLRADKSADPGDARRRREDPERYARDVCPDVRVAVRAFEQAAIAALERCLEVTKKASASPATGEHCRRELGRLDPSRKSPTHELMSGELQLTGRFARYDVQVDVDDEPSFVVLDDEGHSPMASSRPGPESPASARAPESNAPRRSSTRGLGLKIDAVGEIDPALLHRLFAIHVDDLRVCAGDSVQWIDVELTLAHSGQMRAASLTGLDAEARRCVLRRIRSWFLGAPDTTDIAGRAISHPAHGDVASIVHARVRIPARRRGVRRSSRRRQGT